MKAGAEGQDTNDFDGDFEAQKFFDDLCTVIDDNTADVEVTDIVIKGQKK
jgi:hypothetical protein